MAGPLLDSELMRASTIALMASLGGCVASSDTTEPTPPPVVEVVTDGTFAARSELDITVEAVLPEPAYDTVHTLRDFSERPAHTLLDLCDRAGVPAIADIRAALPNALESKLEGYIDEQIAKLTLDGVPVTQIAAEIAALGETKLTRLSIDSELELAGARATHRLVALDFAGTRIAIANLPGEITLRTTTMQRTDATLALGDHTFSLEYGHYAWQALEQAIVDEYGATPRALLGAAVDCPTVATAVASKCVLGACIGHAAELTEICERGLDEVIAVTRRKLEAQRFEALHFVRGTATVVDTDADAAADLLTGGIWTAEVNATQGLRAVPATFTASR